jgi:hypothetical protein
MTKQRNNSRTTTATRCCCVSLCLVVFLQLATTGSSFSNTLTTPSLHPLLAAKFRRGVYPFPMGSKARNQYVTSTAMVSASFDINSINNNYDGKTLHASSSRDRPSTTTAAPLRSSRPQEWWSDFQYGAHQVHTNYLEYVWKFGIFQSFLVVFPLVATVLLGQAVWGSANNLVYAMMSHGLTALSTLSNGISYGLQFPMTFLTHAMSRGIPAALIGSLDCIPQGVAIFLVQIVLWFRHQLRAVWATSFVVRNLGVLVGTLWMNEFHFRYVLDRILGGETTSRTNERHPVGTSSSATTVQFIPLDSSDHTPLDVSTVEPFQVLADASIPPRVSSESSSLTTSSSSTAITSTTAGDADVNRHTSTSLWILASSFLFATSHLSGWWRTPDQYYFPAFLQSAMMHLSHQSLAEIQPVLSVVFLTLALHQAVVAWFLSTKVLTPLYQERGVLASLGGHVMWQVGWILLPFRLLAKGNDNDSKEGISSHESRRQPNNGKVKRSNRVLVKPWQASSQQGQAQEQEQR